MDRLHAEILPSPFLSSVIHAHVDDLFPGMSSLGSYQFRVTRNSDLFVSEEADDLMLALKGELLSRNYGDEVRLEISDDITPSLERFLIGQCDLEDQDVYRVNGPVNLSRLMAVIDMVDRPDLKYPSFTPGYPEGYNKDRDIFEYISARRYVLMHHPYESFEPVVDLLRQALREKRGSIVLASGEAPDELDVLRGELGTLLTRYTEQHPDVRALRRRIRELEGATGPASPSVDPGESSARGELQRAEAELEAIKEKRADLERRYDEIFTTRTCYATLNQTLKRIHKNKAELLLVLERPDIPLHNCVSESDIREYVTKRKISGSTRSDPGRRCRDTFASLKKTCRKQGIGFWEYLNNRICGADTIPWLPDLLNMRLAASLE